MKTTMTAQPDRPTAAEIMAEARALYRAPSLHPKRAIELLPDLANALEEAVRARDEADVTNVRLQKRIEGATALLARLGAAQDTEDMTEYTAAVAAAKVHITGAPPPCD